MQLRAIHGGRIGYIIIIVGVLLLYRQGGSAGGTGEPVGALGWMGEPVRALSCMGEPVGALSCMGEPVGALSWLYGRASGCSQHGRASRCSQLVVWES